MEVSARKFLRKTSFGSIDRHSNFFSFAVLLCHRSTRKSSASFGSFEHLDIGKDDRLYLGRSTYAQFSGS